MYGITRKNLESQEQGRKGSVGNVHDWMKDRKGSVGNVYDWRSLIKFEMIDRRKFRRSETHTR